MLKESLTSAVRIHNLYKTVQNCKICVMLFFSKFVNDLKSVKTLSVIYRYRRPRQQDVPINHFNAGEIQN